MIFNRVSIIIVLGLLMYFIYIQALVLKHTKRIMDLEQKQEQEQIIDSIGVVIYQDSTHNKNYLKQ
jgi:hypothetical protein